MGTRLAEEQHARDPLCPEREHLALALEAADLLVWEWEPASDVLAQSDNAERILGIPAGMAPHTGREFMALVHPEDQERMRQARQRALGEGTGYEEEFRLQRPDGSLLWVADKGRVLQSQDGRPDRMSGVLINVTERKQSEERLRHLDAALRRRIEELSAKMLPADTSQRSRAEQELRESEERFRTSVENLLDAFGIYEAVRDSSGRIVDFRVKYVNAAACKINQPPREQQIGRSLLDFLPRHRDSGLFESYCRVVETGEPLEVNAFPFIMEGSGEGSARRWFDIRATRLGDGFAAAWRDVTWRKEVEVALQKAVEELREADRRKDEFLATLAHELRNPLAPMRNAVQIFRMRGLADPKLQWARDVIDRQVQQLTRLVDDLLDLSRITRGKIELRKERIELAAVVERALELSRPLIASADHQLLVRLPPEPLVLEVDPTRLAQVLANLLNNAAKYTRPGGKIELLAERQGREAVIKVRDNGIGIPRHMLPHIFNMFTQVDSSLERAQGGLGIGLTIVRRLVEMHGGEVSAASEGTDRGSEFTVRLPFAREATHEEQAAPRSEGQQPSPPVRRILVVDDNRDSADSLASLLELSGNEVRVAYDGASALEVAQEYRPEVILLDIGMPGMSGYEVARRLRAQAATRGTLLLAMTGWGQASDRKRSKEAGFNHHLVKPLDLDALDALLAREAPPAPAPL